MSFGFGIVGLGLIADFHARAVSEMADAELVGCLSRSQEKADSFARKHGCRGYSSMHAFLSNPQLDVVTVCTPSGSHLEPAVAAAEAGKHVVVEKPLEITLERCDRIIEVCERNRVALSGIFPSRFKDGSIAISQAIRDGRFGRLVLGDAYVKWYRSQKYYDEGGWHGTWKLDGGGALMNQSIHAVDLLQWFMGPVESVYAYTDTLGHERIEVEDAAVAGLRFRNGALGVIEGSTAVYPGFLKRIEISGTRGSVTLVEEDVKVWSFAEEHEGDQRIREELAGKTETGGGASDPAAIGFQGHQRQFENVTEAIRSGGEPLVGGLEARKAVQIILAIYESGRSGTAVKLPA